MNQFLNQMPNGFSIAYNNTTNQFSISYTTSWQILTNSTIYEVMGFSNNTIYNSISNIITLPYTCNFNGVQNINIFFESINTNNIESTTRSTSSIIQNIIINTGSNQIVFQKTSSFDFTIDVNVLDTLSFSIRDDQMNYINFNNCHWNLTLNFTIIKDIDGFE